MKILIITLQHGNEIFGEKIIDHFKGSDIDTVVANPKAYQQRERFVDTDLNRSYCRSDRKSYEERRANEVYELAKEYDFVIDIHTTTSDIDFVPILARLNSRVAQALSYLPSDNAALMEFVGIGHSLIGCIDTSISLEFNEKFAESKEALDIVQLLVNGLREDVYGEYLDKTLYHIVGTIPEEMNIDGEQNFRFSEKLDCYPFLIGEKHYKGYKGFYAVQTSLIKIRSPKSGSR